jgi:hypothetical protein
MRRAAMMGLGLSGALRGDRTVTLLVPTTRLSLGAVLVANACRVLVHIVRVVVMLVVRRPLSSLAVTGPGAAWCRFGALVLGVAGLVVFAACGPGRTVPHSR